MNRQITVPLALLVVLASDSGFIDGATTNDTSDRVSATIGAGVGDYRHAKLLVSSQCAWRGFSQVDGFRTDFFIGLTMAVQKLLFGFGDEAACSIERERK